MILEFINKMVAYLDANPILVGVVIAATEYVKRWAVKQKFYQAEYMTVVAFVIGYILVIPYGGFEGIDWMLFAARGFGLGLVGSGLYKVGSALAIKK